MSAASRLSLDPRACDRCGRCLEACDRNAVKVGRTFIMIDGARCDGCGACIRVCTRGAIVARPGGPPARSGASRRGSPAPARPVAGPAATPRARSSAAREPRGGARGGFQWTLAEAAAMLSVTFSAFVVKEAVTASAGLSRLQGGGAILARAGVLAAYYAVQVAVLIWLVRRRGGDVAMALGLRSAERSAVRALGSASLVVAGLVATRLVASAYVWLTREIGLMPTSGVDLPGLFGTDAGGLALAVLMVVLVGPAVEEAVFRAALLEGLTARYGVGVALVVQAALFAAFHRSAWLFLPTFVLGVVLGWLAHERESLWPAIGLHALYNAVTVAAAFAVAVGA